MANIIRWHGNHGELQADLVSLVAAWSREKALSGHCAVYCIRTSNTDDGTTVAFRHCFFRLAHSRTGDPRGELHSCDNR